MPEFFPYIFISIPLIIILLGEITGICVIHSGQLLKKRINYMFTFVVAAVQCMFAPFGTVLGIFTILYLQKDFVRKSYGIIDGGYSEES